MSSYNAIRTVFLTFNSTGLASATVSVPFTITEVRVLQIALDTDQTYSTVNSQAVLQSSIVNGGTLGTVNMTNAQNSTQNVRHIYRTPTTIQGLYTFQLVTLTGVPYTVSGTATSCVVILEFLPNIE